MMKIVYYILRDAGTGPYKVFLTPPLIFSFIINMSAALKTPLVNSV